LPILGQSLMRAITVGDVAELITELRAKGRSEKTIAGGAEVQAPPRRAQTAYLPLGWR
jgi:hypothetical protein